MPRSKKPVEEPRNVTPAGDIDQREEDYFDGLEGIIEQFPDSKKAYVRRLSADGATYDFVGKIDAALCTEDYIQNRWRGGTYQVQFADIKGRFRKMISDIRIVEPDSPAVEIEPRAPAKSVALAPIDPMAAVIQQMREENMRTHLLLMKMIEANSMREPAGGGNNIGDIVLAMKGIRDMTPAPAVSFPETLTMKMFDMLSKQGGGAPAGDGSFASEARMFFTDVVRDLIPQFTKQSAVPNPPPATAIAAAPVVSLPEGPAAGDEEEMDEALSNGLDFIYGQFQGDEAPETVASMIRMYGRFNPKFVEDLKLLLAESVAELAESDPRLNELKYRQWFNSLFEVLRVQYLGSAGHSTGTTGN